LKSRTGEAAPQRVKGLVFDLDGTLVRGPNALAGAVEAVAAIRAMGISLAFVTQDSVNPPQHVANKLAKLGFGAKPDDVFCAGWFAAKHLAETYPGQKIYAICSPDLRQSFLEQGIELVSEAEAASAKVAFVARDPALTAQGFAAACTAIWAGATFYAFGHDRLLPVAGRNAPGAGAFVKAIEFATRRRAKVLGKPSKPLAFAALRRLGVTPREAIVVGDSLESDIRLGRGVGAGGVLVLTGGATAKDAESATGLRRPDAVLSSVAALPAWLNGG
jgi:4-nitrophenyl phosphatase